MDQTYYEKCADDTYYFNVMDSADNLTSAHFHNCTEIIAVRAGRERVVINGTARELTAGEFAVSGSLDIHFYEPVGSSEVTVVMMSEEYTARFREWGGKLPNFLPKTERSGEILSLIDSLRAAAGKSRLVIAGYIDVFLGTLAEIYPTEPKRGRHESNRIAEILAYLDEHYAEKLSIATVAETFGYSATYFSALFNRYTGMHFKDYLNRLRIQRAAAYTDGRNCKLDEILSACGFESANTYYRARKRWAK